MQKYYVVWYNINGKDQKTRFINDNIFAIWWDKIWDLSKYKSLNEIAVAIKKEYPKDTWAKTTFKNFIGLKKWDKIWLKKRVLKAWIAETIVYAVWELKEWFPKWYSYEKWFWHKINIERKVLEPEWKIDWVAYASTLSVVKQTNIQQEIDNLLWEWSYELFEKYYKENASNYMKTPEYKKQVEARKQFLSEYPLEDFMDIELDDYVIGSWAKGTLCYEFEFWKYANLWPWIWWGSAWKYGIYFKKAKNAYVDRHWDPVQDPEKYWTNIKKEIVKLVNDIKKAEDPDDFNDWIETFKSMQLPLTKLLNAYCPEKIIGIASLKLLKWIANAFHIHYDEKNTSWIKLNFLITKTLKEHLKCLNHSDHELISHMVWDFPNRLPDTQLWGWGEWGKPPIPTYWKYEFLDEVFMTESQYDEVADTLIRKKNIILMGAPWVWKTFCAKKLMYSIMGEPANDRIVTVQFHQSYSYEDFIQGYRPTDKWIFKLEEWVFYKLVEDARTEYENSLDKWIEPQKYCIIIDEINRWNLSKVFWELMMLIESDKRTKDWAVKLTYSKNKDFYIPSNLYIIWTMNTADRSLTMIDYALRRRFAFIQLDPAFSNEESANKLKSWLLRQEWINEDFIDSLINKYSKLNDNIEKSLWKGFRIWHSYFIGQNLSDNPYEVYNDILNYEIKPLLEEYYYDEKSKVDEALWIIKDI